MIKIKKGTDLGLLLLGSLAGMKKHQLLSLQLWAKENRLPYRFLSKIAGDLKQAGLIIAKEGKAGGYGLARPAGKIYLGEVIKALEGDLVMVKCQAKTCSSRGICRHFLLMNRLGSMIAKELNRISLKSLYAGR